MDVGGVGGYVVAVVIIVEVEGGRVGDEDEM